MGLKEVFPVKFHGIPTLTIPKVLTLNDMYFSALNDASTSTGENDIAYYLGQSDGLEYALALLYQNAESVVKTAAKVTKESNGNFKRAVFISGAVTVGYVLYKNQKRIKKSASVWVDVIHYGAEHPPKNFSEVQTLKKNHDASTESPKKN